MEGWLRLHHLPALHLRGGSALPHPVGLQPQAAAVTARRAPEKEVQALGTNVAERSWLGSRRGLVFLLRRACLSSPCTARHRNRFVSTTQKGKIRTQPILFALRPCIYCVLMHLRVRTPTVAGKFTLPTTSGICPAFAGWFSNQAVTPAVATSVPWMKPGS